LGPMKRMVLFFSIRVDLRSFAAGQSQFRACDFLRLVL